MDSFASSPLEDARVSAINPDRMVFGSIIALALGVIPILVLSERRAPAGIHAWRLALCCTFLVTAVIGFLLVRRGHKRPAALLMVGALWVGATGFAFATGIGLHSAVVYLYLVSILFTSLLCGLVPATLQTAMTVAALTGMYWAEAHGWIGGLQAFMEKTTTFNYYLGIVVSSVGALVVATAYQRTVENSARATAEAHAKLARLNADLERLVAERTRELEGTIHELESFNYSVSHDLRTPLRSIHGFASRLRVRMEGTLDAEAKHQLERVAAEAKRMDELLMALLGFGRISRRPLQLTEINLTAAVARIAGELAATPDGARTRFSVQPDLRARCDRTLIFAVLEQLLGNAVKFSHAQTEPRVEFGFTTTVSGEAWYVRDNGAGFDPAFASHLYKPFHRLHSDNEFAGLGMGLASVRRIIERHGGRIWAESAPGQGATFYFTLPRRP